MNKRILALAIPNIISNLSVPLLGSVDTALMGHIDDPAYLGAMAVGGMIFSFLFWGLGFLRMGTTGLTAQEFGRRDDGAMGLILLRASLLAVGIGIGIILLQQPVLALALWLVKGTAEVEQLTTVYFTIRIYSAPATLLFYVFSGWFLGMQNAWYPMVLTIFLNGLNVVLDVLFVHYWHMDIDGVALGSVIARYVAILIALLILWLKYKPVVRAAFQKKIMEMAELKKYFTVNGDIFIRTLCLIFTFSFFTAESATYGETILAANTILIQLWMIFSYGIDGFAFAGESLVGRYTGAGSSAQLRRTISYLFLWGLGLGLAGSLAYGFFMNPILHIFTDQQPVIETAMAVMLWTAAAPLVNSPAYIWDGVFIGATATGAMRNAMLIVTVLLFLPVYYILKPFWDVNALWLAMLLFMAARGGILSLFAPRYIFKKGQK